jgi:UDP-N-acetylmuramoyl-tripeptide--D-alanyl-D-alanine ligase
VDIVVVVGEGAAGIVAGAASLGEAVVAVPDRAAALAALREMLRPGDAVLVKASRGAELEWIVESLAGSWGSRSDGGAPGSGAAASDEALEDDR